MIYVALLMGALLASLVAGRNDRGPAIVSGLAILGGWLLFVSSWTRFAPAHVFTWLSYSDIWAMTDLAVAAVIGVVARDRWWGKALWSLIFAQVCLHVAHQYLGLNFASYSMFLDALFLGQLAVFYMLGGGAIVDFLSHGHVDGDHVFRAAQAAPSEKERS